MIIAGSELVKTNPCVEGYFAPSHAYKMPHIAFAISAF